jgi:hypothetical protein
VVFSGRTPKSHEIDKLKDPSKLSTEPPQNAGRNHPGALSCIPLELKSDLIEKQLFTNPPFDYIDGPEHPDENRGVRSAEGG